ncbi:MAG: hypothetical protein RIT01_691 [Pseudomonadota bacterium]
MLLDPSFVLNLVILCGILSIVFAYVTGVQILSNARMKEIAGAIQIGARAYLNRQYKTIAIVGVLVLIAVIYLFNFWVGLGYFIGARSFFIRNSWIRWNVNFSTSKRKNC